MRTHIVYFHIEIYIDNNNMYYLYTDLVMASFWQIA